MTKESSESRLGAIQNALHDVSTSMAADGYRLVVDSAEGATLNARVVALEGACDECLVPKHVMARMILHSAPSELGLMSVELTYPADSH